MENKTDHHEDQAAELRKLLDEVQQGEKEINHQQKPESNEEFEQIREIDILNLPPRGEVHGKMNKRTHIKVRAPFMRLLLVIIILAGIVLGAYYFYGEEIIELLLDR